MATLSDHKVRQLSASELGLDVAPIPAATIPSLGDIEALTGDDPLLETTLDLLDTFGGVIFVGAPGTSKSWYAARIAFSLVDGDVERFRLVQFHPSYQYEDFVQGYVPRDDGQGFVLKPKHFMAMCEIATRSEGRVVLVIDELSRGDPGRVFGEALTYLEKSKRGIEFQLASGDTMSVPDNLVILATMNPLDRGVDEVDGALERRFAKIAMDPNPDLLARLLGEAGMPNDLRGRVVQFFEAVNERAESNPYAAIGHTYFVGINDVPGLTRIWEHQLRFHFEKAYRLDKDGKAEVFRRWNLVIADPTVPPDEPEDVAVDAEPA